MGSILGTITSRMRRNFFSSSPSPQPQPSGPASGPVDVSAPQPQTGKTFPADEVVWGIAIRNGFDEIDDPSHHRGTTQHAYLEGNDNVAICGFRPPQSGPRTRRRSRLGLPSSGENPMCGMCARMVVAPRPRVPVPVQTGRPSVAVPVKPGVQPVPVPITPGVAPAAIAAGGAPVPPPHGVPPVAMPPGVVPPLGQPRPGVTSSQASATPTPGTGASPWVRRRSGMDEPAPKTITVDPSATHDSGLMERGVHAELDGD